MVFFTNNDEDKKQNTVDFSVFTNSTSIERSCKSDPEDENYLLCKVKETKLKNVNGENKYVTEERDERVHRSKNNLFSGNPFFSHPDLENLGEEGRDLVKKMNDFTFMPFFGLLDSLFSSPFPKFYEREFDSYSENREKFNMRTPDHSYKKEENSKSQNNNFWRSNNYNFPKKNTESRENNVYDA